MNVPIPNVITENTAFATQMMTENSNESMDLVDFIVFRHDLCVLYKNIPCMHVEMHDLMFSYVRSDGKRHKRLLQLEALSRFILCVVRVSVVYCCITYEISCLYCVWLDLVAVLTENLDERNKHRMSEFRRKMKMHAVLLSQIRTSVMCLMRLDREFSPVMHIYAEKRRLPTSWTASRKETQ